MPSMRPTLNGVGILALLLAFAGAASGARAQEVAGTCKVHFYGTSTLHDFEGTAPCALLAIAAPDAAGRYSARAEVAIAQLETGISARDKKMREMFEAKKFPRVVATFSALEPAALRAQAPEALPFRIALHGVERPVTPTISKYAEVPGKSARFSTSFDLSLSDFGLKAPVAMGFIRVDEKVKVVVDVELTAKNGVAPSRPQAH